MTAPTAARPLTTSELLLEADRRRPRSQQRRIGMSELGGCRKRAGYRLAGTEHTDTSGSVQAVMGTAIHDAIASVLALTKAPGDLVEHEVEFADVLGHLDRYEAATKTVVDVKTTSSRWLEHLKVHGPSREHLWQTHGYAAGLIQQGVDVRQVRIDYLARDTGEEWTVTLPFEPAVIAHALAWLDEVRTGDLDMLPRDYAPESPFCRNCPFRTPCWDGGVTDRDPRSVLFVQNPDAAKWAEQLYQARLDKSEASAREEEAKGALDALRPNDEGTQVVDVGWTRPLVWQVSRGAVSLDRKAVEADYKKAGAKVPYKIAKPSVKLLFGEAEQ